MSRLGNISGKEAEGIRKSWLASDRPGRESLVMVKPGIRVNLSIPQHKELSVGTLRALIRGAGMTVDEFLSLL
jgi:hypothetical protein